MPPFFAHTPHFGVVLMLGGVALVFLCQIWLCVVAARRGFLWLLGVIFLPFIGFLLPFYDERALKPLLGTVAALWLTGWSIMGVDDEPTRKRSIKEKVYLMKQTIRSGEMRSETLAAWQGRLQAWQQNLEAKKATLDPKNPAAKAAFDRELQDYTAELTRFKEETARASL